MSLRRFDVQAKLSLVTSLVSALGLALLVAMIWRNYQHELRAIVYKATSFYSTAFLLGCAVTMLLAAAGLALGISSAGQRRNEYQRASWLGFFLGTAVLAGTIVCFAMFYVLKLQFQ